MTLRFVQQLVDAASMPYRSSGRFAWYFARGKLGSDPVFAGILEHGLIPDNARILDIGCGQGLLASWLLSAKAMHAKGLWPTRWPKAPNPVSIHGIDLMLGEIERARQALGAAATFTAANMCEVDFGKADVVVVLDVLHYVDIEAQNDVLRRARDALEPNGILILRVGDANGGLAFRFSVWIDHLILFARRRRNSRICCRPLSQWRAALMDLGFHVDTLPMNKGTPFANVLLIAKLGKADSVQ